MKGTEVLTRRYYSRVSRIIVMHCIVYGLILLLKCFEGLSLVLTLQNVATSTLQLSSMYLTIDTKSLHGLETEYLSVLLYSAYLNCKLLRILFLLGTKSSARASSSLYVSDSCGHAMVNLLLQVLTRFVGLHNMMPACEENYTK